MGKYFGTDGFRGEAGITLTADHAYKVGRFLGWYYNALRERNGDTDPARIVIGKDTRRSSYMFEYSLVAGLTASGADAYLLHVTTTPSVAYIARVDDFDCGIMISASHNPYYDNGIKLIDCYGEKMPEETLLLVEDYIDGKLHVFDKDWPELPFAHREHIGCTVDYVAGRNRYMGYLISLGIYSFKGVKVGLDCANGSSWNIAKSVFDALGADTYVMERGTEYALEQIYNIIDSRYRSRKPLIVTTNLTLTELKKPQDIAHARIYDRLLELCTPIACTGPSMRKDIGQAKLDLLKTLLA